MEFRKKEALHLSSTTQSLFWTIKLPTKVFYRVYLCIWNDPALYSAASSWIVGSPSRRAANSSVNDPFHVSTAVATAKNKWAKCASSPASSLHFSVDFSIFPLQSVTFQAPAAPVHGRKLFHRSAEKDKTNLTLARSWISSSPVRNTRSKTNLLLLTMEVVLTLFSSFRE